jgi:putative glutamine amidotransferase
MSKTCYVAAYETLANDYLQEIMELVEISLNWGLVWSTADKPDIILYAGGQDISPSMYGQKPLATTDKPNYYRDGAEVQAYLYSQNLSEKPVWNVGICRGMQLLNVLNGGKLQQHVEGHVDSVNGKTMHPVEYFGANKKDTYGSVVNSVHHQVIIPPRNGKDKNNPYELLVQTIGLLNDPEAILFPKTKSVGVQWHPEWAGESSSGSLRLFKRIIEDYIEKEAA